MKKRLLFLMVIGLVVTACSSSRDDSLYNLSSYDRVSSEAITSDVETEDWDSADDGMLEFEAEDRGFSARTQTASAVNVTISAERIIHHASASVRTTDFDETIALVYELVERYDAFIQRSDIIGHNIGVYERFSSFTIRVPVGMYHEMVSALDDLGTVDRLNTTATNVSASHADLTSRLNALRVQEERILDLLEWAENLADMLILEERLGEIIRQIESLTGERTHLDNQVAYSTVEIDIWEVEEIIEGEEPYPEPSPSRVTAAFLASLRALRFFGMGLIIIIAALIPWVAAFFIVTSPLWIWLHRRKKRKKKLFQSDPTLDTEK